MKQFLTILFSLLLMATSANAQLTGQFSVSASKQVYFSKGNLRYHCSTKAWSFATNQYDVVGQSNSNISSSYAGYIDLFGWGTSGNNNLMPYETSLSVNYGAGNNSIANTTYDWGSKVSGEYRTLTQNEWTYLLTERNNAYLLRGPATVNGVNGWILLPDNWSQPASITFTSFDDGARAYTANVYTASEFSTMQSAGAVFLPVTGYRYSSGSVSVVSGVNSMGYYWSADKANVSFMGNYMYCSSEMQTYMGLAVRLVTETLSSSSSGGGSSSQQYYTLTTVVEPDGAGKIYGGGSYRANEYVTVRANANEGWEFAYFTSTNYYADYYSTPWSFRLSKPNVTVTAHFRPIQYCIYSNSSNSGKGTTEPEHVCAAIGTRVNFNAIPKPGCRFTRWTDGVTTATRTYTIQSPDDNNTYLWAEFESVANYTVTATSAQPTMGSVSGAGTYAAGTRVELLATPNHSYKFLYWNNNPSNNHYSKYIYLYGDSTYTAYFGPASIVTLNLQVDNPANGTVTGGGNYYEQESVTITANVTPGKRFVQWMTCTQDGNGETTEKFLSNQNPYTFTILQNTTIKALFEDSPEYTVTLQNDASKGTARYYPQKETYLYGDSITLEAVGTPCYKPAYWRVTPAGTVGTIYYTNPLTIAVTSSLTVEPLYSKRNASFSLHRHVSSSSSYGTVTIITADGVNQGSSYTGCPEEIVTLTATPNSGYYFDHWGDGNTDNPRQFALPYGGSNGNSSMYYFFNKTRAEGTCGSPVLEDARYTLDIYNGLDIHGSGAVKKYNTQQATITINSSFESEQVTLSGAPWGKSLGSSYDETKDSLSYVCVHDTITELPDGSFLNCRKPRKLFVKSINFRKIGSSCFELCKNLHYIELGDSLQEIGNNAFIYTNLEEVIIPASVKKLGVDAFSYNSNLRRIVFLGTMPPTKTSSSPFSGAGTDTIFVPTGSRQAYIDAKYKSSPIKYVIEWHRVNTEVVGNGTCSYAAKQLICAGDTVTLHVTPEGGNIIHSIILTDGAGNTIPLTQDYRFEMPENDVTVRVVFVNSNDYTPIHLTTRQLNTTSAVLAFAWETNEPVHMFDFFIRNNDEIVYSGITSTPSISISTMETPVPGTYQYTWGVRSRDESGDPIGEWAYSEAALEIQGTQGIETIKINGEDASGKPVKLLWNNQIYIIRGDKIYSITGQLVK